MRKHYKQTVKLINISATSNYEEGTRVVNETTLTDINAIVISRGIIREKSYTSSIIGTSKLAKHDGYYDESERFVLIDTSKIGTFDLNTNTVIEIGGVTYKFKDVEVGLFDLFRIITVIGVNNHG